MKPLGIFRTSPRHPPAWDEQVRVDVCGWMLMTPYAFRAPCLFTRGGCVLSTTSCKGRGLCNNVDRNPGRHGRRTGFLPSDRPAILVKSRDHVRTARALSAAAGHRGCDVVGSSPADAELLVLRAERSPPRDPLIRPSYVTTNRSLAALLPGSTVLVGSVRIHAVPGMARRFRGAEMCTTPVCGRVHRVPVRRLYVDLNLLQSPAVGLQSGIGQKIVLRTALQV
jgi:hypothetical protein